jgi:hypothetical protein
MVELFVRLATRGQIFESSHQELKGRLEKRFTKLQKLL